MLSLIACVHIHFSLLSTTAKKHLAKLIYVSNADDHLTIIHHFSVCLFVCSRYKSVPLHGTPQNALHPLMRPWDVFLRDGHATTCAVEEDCQAFVIPGSATPF